MIPQRYAQVLFSLLLSGMMSAIVSGIVTVRTSPIDLTLPGIWFSSWLSSWLIAFPAVLVVAPITRRLVAKWTKPDGS